MQQTSDLSTPQRARDHARAMAGTRVRAMPTLPASDARDLPEGVMPHDVVWDETLDAGDYAARVVRRGTRVRLTNLEGDACANVVLYNADRPIERLNVADTVKVQWNAYLGPGKLLLSDMGRVLMSMTADTSGRHDTLCGASSATSNARKYERGENYTDCPNARDRFALALAKYGLGRRDIPPNVNIFKRVTVAADGSLVFDAAPGAAGEFVEFCAEMNVLFVAANTPHVMDPRSRYVATPLRILAYRGALTPPDDAIRKSTPEATRAFLNTEDYFVA